MTFQDKSFLVGKIYEITPFSEKLTVMKIEMSVRNLSSPSFVTCNTCFGSNVGHIFVLDEDKMLAAALFSCLIILRRKSK